MLSEAEQFVAVFDHLGCEILAHLKGLSKSAMHWSLPLPQSDSPFRRAQRIIDESSFWVLEVVGGSSISHEQRQEPYVWETFDDLALRYERWNAALHQVLDELPNAMMDQFVELPAPSRDLFSGKPATVRICLLYALEQSAVQVGHIQFICQLFADGERMFHEVARHYEISASSSGGFA